MGSSLQPKEANLFKVVVISTQPLPSPVATRIDLYIGVSLPKRLLGSLGWYWAEVKL